MATKGFVINFPEPWWKGPIEPKEVYERCLREPLSGPIEPREIYERYQALLASCGSLLENEVQRGEVARLQAERDAALAEKAELAAWKARVVQCVKMGV